ncbi:ATP-binding protein [Oceanobacillus sp. FSL H7-0719]|uniref:ATP-binding protein n=1 Tax=Oceanobacillus sp. FSL H7-0719 TaxID=2954507 RepID=UPI003245DD94
MNKQIEEYAKRLKLSWIRENYHEVEASNNQEYLLKLFEKVVQNREERRINLLPRQARLPKMGMCYENKSIVITTNLQFGQWNHVFGDPVLTEAVIDRLIHHSHLLLFTGDSFRYKKSLLHG